MLMNVTFDVKILNERDKSTRVSFNQINDVCVNMLEFGVNDRIFFGDKQRKK